MIALFCSIIQDNNMDQLYLGTLPFILAKHVKWTGTLIYFLISNTFFSISIPIDIIIDPNYCHSCASMSNLIYVLCTEMTILKSTLSIS